MQIFASQPESLDFQACCFISLRNKSTLSKPYISTNFPEFQSFEFYWTLHSRMHDFLLPEIPVRFLVCYVLNIISDFDSFPVFSYSGYAFAHSKKQPCIKFSLTFLTSPAYFALALNICSLQHSSPFLDVSLLFLVL